jgi:hypothetical protein
MEFVNPPAIKLPVTGVALIKYLEEVNEYESSRASAYIKSKMANLLLHTIQSWFKVTPPELDRALMKKISNSVLAAGIAGLDRTVEALSELRFERALLTSPRTAKGAAVELREAVRDYREAKNWVSNKSKCVNSILKSSQLLASKDPDWQDLATRVIDNSVGYQDWENWQESLFKLWSKNTKVAERLHGSYQNHWQFFKGTFDQNMMNGQYSLLLVQQIDQVIQGIDAYIKDYEQAYEDSMFTPKKIIGNYELEVITEGSEVSFFLTLNERFAKPGKLNSIKSDLIYQLSDQVEKASSGLAISEIASDFPTLRLRMKKPSKKSDFDAISASISNFCEEL